MREMDNQSLSWPNPLSKIKQIYHHFAGNKTTKYINIYKFNIIGCKGIFESVTAITLLIYTKRKEKNIILLDMPLLGKASSTMVKACIALYTRIQLSQPVKPHFFTRTQIPATITFPSFMSKNMFLQQYFKKINKVGKLLQNAPFFSLLFFVAKDWLSIPLVQVSAMRFYSSSVNSKIFSRRHTLQEVLLLESGYAQGRDQLDSLSSRNQALQSLKFT